MHVLNKTTLSLAIALLMAVGLAALALSGTEAAGSTDSIAGNRSAVTWSIAGQATKVSALSEAPECAAAAAPSRCLVLVNPDAPSASGPCADVSGGAGLRARCELADGQALQIVGGLSEGGGPTAITVNSRAPSGCSDVAIQVEQQRSGTPTNVEDGCVQTVRCGPAYTGRVTADRGDVIAAECTDVVREGQVERETQDVPCDPCAPDISGSRAPDEGAPLHFPGQPSPEDGTYPSTAAEQNPAATQVNLSKTGSRGLRLRWTQATAAAASVTVQRYRAGAFRAVRQMRLTSRTGSRSLTISRASGKRLVAGRYRIRLKTGDGVVVTRPVVLR